MILSIVLPTIDGRQDQVVRTVAAYERRTPDWYGHDRGRVEIEWIVEVNHPNCGMAWNAGARRASGDILHMTADDLEPESTHWLHAAMHAIDRDRVPVGHVREDGIGRFGGDFCRVPICRREWWHDVVEVQYWSDNHFDDLMRDQGHTPMLVPDFDFYHRRSMVGRDESPPRLQHDRTVYLNARKERSS